MAAEELAHKEFNEILSRLDRRFEIIHVKWTEEKFFEAKFRTQIQRNSDDFNALCDEWVDLFSDTTNTVWVKKISNTGPKIRFRKQYQCWTQGGKEIQKELLFDARRCKGTLDMKVLTDNPLTRRKNKHIRMGLNVVVKINFTHLHPAQVLQPYAFFVHCCDPLPEPPKPVIQPNDKLPQLVAEMVQKGMNACPPAPIVIDNVQSNNVIIQQDQPPMIIQPTLEQNEKNITLLTTMAPSDLLHKSIEPLNAEQKLSDNQIQMASLEPVQLNHVVPLQNMDTIKLEAPQFQQLTQVVVSPPFELNESLLMCQPTLMFDPSQVIPVSTLPHFVQVHNQQGHYL